MCMNLHAVLASEGGGRVRGGSVVGANIHGVAVTCCYMRCYSQLMHSGTANPGVLWSGE